MVDHWGRCRDRVLHRRRTERVHNRASCAPNPAGEQRRGCPGRRMALMLSMVPYFVSKVDLSRLQFPTEAHAPEQIKHRLVVHDLRGGHQYRQDDAAFASIDHRMHMIAQVNAPAFQTHRSRIWIGRTDTEISPTLVIMVQTANLSLRFPGSGDPVVPLGILSAKLRHRSGSERATGSG